MTLLSFFLILCSHALAVSPAPGRGSDQLALLSFKSTIAPPRGLLASWNTSTHHCSWPGVACGRRHPDRVVSLRMASFNLSGRISPFLGNLSFLRELDLGDNHLAGQIPPELGHLARLRLLSLRVNSLQGSIPVALGGCTNLTTLDLSRNHLQGEIPGEIGSSLKNLVTLNLSRNDLSGHIPGSLVQSPSIQTLSMFLNRLSGRIPPVLGNLSNLKYLQVDHNALSGPIPPSLGMLPKLSRLSIGFNNLSGVIPNSIWNISSLTLLSVQENMLSGTIPPNAFSNLHLLQDISLDANHFHGPIPAAIANASNIALLQMSENFFSGIVPPEVGSFPNLFRINLQQNLLRAKEPKDWEFITTLTNCTQLQVLGLGTNKFEGVLPDSLSNLSTSLVQLGLQENKISGSLPKDIGEIPSTIGGCQLLQQLYLQNNKFEGTIPSVLSQMKGLQTLDISSNNLSGQIPKSFADLTTLYYLNLSFNSLAGEVPITGVFANSSAISIQGNGNLCGGVPNLHLAPCSLQLAKKKHKFPVACMPISIIATLVVLAFLYKLLLTWQNKRQATILSTTSMQGYQLISYSQLARATYGFSAGNLLGSGSFGSVYKGELDGHAGENSNLVAVKVLKLQTPKAPKSFTAECKALGNMRHRNLLKIVTVCSSIDTRGNEFKAIVYDFMPNGSLEGWLHLDTSDQAEQKYLNLHQRVTILLDVAYALDYLHCHGPAPVVHCDVKPSNVLLDDNMVAHVGDFGLAKILNEGSSFLEQSMSSMGFRGTIGYAAPEYGVGNPVSKHGDIYSYGILVLETATGKRPTDSKFRQGLSLREYVELGLCDSMMEVVDMRLSLDLEYGLQTVNASAYKRTIDCLVSLLKLGISCSQELPSSRMPTGDIVKELHAMKESLSRE
uniref:Receptor kinase-like protein Xa21 n=1 Tax=Aegilops tauschii TaxID=37682 RepID=R7WEQ8_AEGTA